MKYITILLLCLSILYGTALGQNSKKTVIVAVSTGLYDSGLLNHLKPLFEKQSGFTLEFKSIGSGQALKSLTKGEVDAVITSNRSAEEYIVNSGHSRERTEFAYTYYLLLGPPEDPAIISGCQDITTAFKKIRSQSNPFVSRGDFSGTNAKELTIWKKCGIKPEVLENEKFYIQTGKGSMQTLLTANSIHAYTLSDYAVYKTAEANITLKDMQPQLKKDKCIYTILTPDYKKFKKTNYKGAYALKTFLTSKEAQKTIKNYGVEKYGTQLYYGVN